MFDRKQLEAFLDSLEVETHFPKPIFGNSVDVLGFKERSGLDKKMDKYDIFMQPGYENVGTPEHPIYYKPDPVSRLNSYISSMFQYGFSGWHTMSPTYGGIRRGDRPSSTPVETPWQKFQKKAARFQDVAPVKIENPKPAPPRTHRSPDYVGTITAWRGWSFSNGLLNALGTNFAWPAKTAARAYCRQSSHDAPQINCSCGFWSFKTQELMTEAMSSYLTEVDVIGTVEIWGRVIECENGYRSEYAYPKELWLLEEGLESLSWTYGVPVRKLT